LTVEKIVAKSSNEGLAKFSLQVPLSELLTITATLGIGRPLEMLGVPGGFSEDTAAWWQWTSPMQACRAIQ
jgi:hypothetical protein